MAITKLVLVRHGESQWNNENRFTGWYDVDLSEKGVSEAKALRNTVTSRLNSGVAASRSPHQS